MGYEAALKKAWDAFEGLGTQDRYAKFLNDEYEIDYTQRKIISMSCNTPANDYFSFLILHYLSSQGRVLRISSNNWVSFKELDGGEAYFSAFRKRAIDPILRKYGDNPAGIFDKSNLFNAEIIGTGTAAISINAFPKIKIAVILWAKDDEFDAECNMLFNPEIKQIFPTEDVAVLGSITASLL